MQPRIYNKIEGLKFLYQHPSKFDNVVIPAMTCLMKITVDLSVEILMIFVTFGQKDQMDAVFAFASLIVISNIDQFYLQSIQNQLKEELKSEAVDYTI
jgi:hypothetical protein